MFFDNQRFLSEERMMAMAKDINVLALVKGIEGYVFIYDNESRVETLRILGRFASNSELSFTWYDAAVLSQKIRQESRKRDLKKRFTLPLPLSNDINKDVSPEKQPFPVPYVNRFDLPLNDGIDGFSIDD